MTFNFGTAGENIPVKDNEIWGVGPHRFACLDWTDEVLVEKAFSAFGVDGFSAVYMDLPYNKGLATSFYTKASKLKKVSDDDFIAMLKRSVKLASLTKTYSIIEIGVAHADELAAIAQEMGATVQQIVDITYYKTRPSKMVNLYWEAQPFVLPDMTGMDDEQTPAAMILAVKKNVPLGRLFTVFDPCTGLGLTPISSVKAGAIAYGFELVPRRLAVTLHKMRKIVKQEPIKIGDL